MTIIITIVIHDIRWWKMTIESNSREYSRMDSRPKQKKKSLSIRPQMFIIIPGTNDHLHIKRIRRQQPHS